MSGGNRDRAICPRCRTGSMQPGQTICGPCVRAYSAAGTCSPCGRRVAFGTRCYACATGHPRLLRWEDGAAGVLAYVAQRTAVPA